MASSGLPEPPAARWKAAGPASPAIRGRPAGPAPGIERVRFGWRRFRWPSRVTRTSPNMLVTPRPSAFFHDAVPGSRRRWWTRPAHCSRRTVESNVACEQPHCGSRPSAPVASPARRRRGSPPSSRPGGQACELLHRGGERRRQLPLQRDLAPVLADLPDRHREPHRHRHLQVPAGNDSRPSSRTRPPDPRKPRPDVVPALSRPRHRRHADQRYHCGHCRKHPETPTLPIQSGSSKKSAEFVPYQKDAPVEVNL